MDKWLAEHISGPMVTAIITGTVVPILIVWYRKRRTVSEIGEALSKSEATFRTDLILRLDKMQNEYDEMHAALRECEKHHAAAQIRILQLEAALNG
jgi:endonuclease V-like protein UPF0215 family